MNSRALWQRRRNSLFVVAPVSASTWVVAISRRLIPGALFTTQTAAVIYAFLLATAAGLDHTNILVLGEM